MVSNITAEAFYDGFIVKGYFIYLCMSILR